MIRVKLLYDYSDTKVLDRSAQQRITRFIMSLEKQSDGSIIKKGPIVTADQANFIAESEQPPLHVYGLLARIRHTGKTLEVIYNQAISEPGNKEHIPAVTQARAFLVKNSERFGLVIPPNESV